MPGELTRTSVSLTLAAGIGSIVVPAGGGRLDVCNPDATNILYGSWDASPATGAAALGAYPIPAAGGLLSQDGVSGTFYLFSGNANAKVTANIWG